MTDSHDDVQPVDSAPCDPACSQRSVEHDEDHTQACFLRRHPPTRREPMTERIDPDCPQFDSRCVESLNDSEWGPTFRRLFAARGLAVALGGTYPNRGVYAR